MRRILIAISLGLIAATALAAGPDDAPPEAILKGVLGLDDGQLRAIQQLAQTRQQTVQPIAQQLGAQHQALYAALEASDPDPAAVGKIVIATRDLQRQIEQAQHAFADGFLALLTDAQRAQVQHIRGVEGALRAAQALHALGL